MNVFNPSGGARWMLSVGRCFAACFCFLVGWGGGRCAGASVKCHVNFAFRPSYDIFYII